MLFLDNDLFKNFQIERWKAQETNIQAFRQSGMVIDRKYISVSTTLLLAFGTLSITQRLIGISIF